MEAPILSPGSIGNKPSWDSGSWNSSGLLSLANGTHGLINGFAEFQDTVMSSAQEKNTDSSTLPPIQGDNLSYMLVTLSQDLV